MLNPSEASARILEDIRPLPAEKANTVDCAGRVLAEDVIAPVTIPPWNNASMDGFAVQATDVNGATATNAVILPVVESIAAGQFPSRSLCAGEAMRIMTGAPVPEGADSVIRIEDTDGGTHTVAIRDARDGGRNVRPAGEDFRQGDVLGGEGTVVTPTLIGVLLSGGAARISVYRRPRVAVISSGDELVTIDKFSEVESGRRIVSTNSYTLPALVRDAGGDPVDLGIAADTREALREKLEQASGCDLIITSAGISVGDADFTRDVFASLGGKQKFWKVRIRPGAPLAFGQLHGVPWIGLSGNPVSAVVTFELFARPAIRKMIGHSRLFRRPLPVDIESDVSIAAELTHFLRANVRREGDSYRARLTRSQSSASLTSLAAANALLVVPPEKRSYAAGTRMFALPLADYPFELEQLTLA
ncbi:MAG: molybdopterin molybdotransferase MoeA [Gemmatimonadaceae bacterium]|nr:molybdopterin molybdotransferase MoeA [Gemmatimonadaceae bacterium]